ncbi:MAG: restriction endonuclease subunit S, partial [Rickettsiales bacterium]|nr:restriction endonuclease subunit S [Rickettsiales bacterium]
MSDRIQNIIDRVKQGDKVKVDTREWKEFIIGEIFKVSKSKAYHKSDLKIVESDADNSVPHISRTALNNGIDCYVIKEPNMRIEKENAITLGAEVVTFFYQSQQFICGNSISIIRHKNLNKNTAIFLCFVFKSAFKQLYNYNNSL